MNMLKKILGPKMRGALRHALSSLGPLIAAHGITSDAYWQTLVGVLMASLAFYDSWTAPEKGGGA